MSGFFRTYPQQQIQLLFRVFAVALRQLALGAAGRFTEIEGPDRERRQRAQPLAAGKAASASVTWLRTSSSSSMLIPWARPG